MEITRVINNNVVTAKDENKQDIIVMGKGVGFQKKVGAQADEEKIERTFALADREQYSKFKSLVQSIEPQAIELGEEIISHAISRHPEKSFAPIIHISLNDHISGVFERHKRGITLENAIWPAVRRMHRSEFEIGLYAVRRINEKLGSRLGNDEAGFVAVHFVNAQTQKTAPDVERVSKLLKDIIRLVNDYFHFEPDETSPSYYRFLEHISMMSNYVFGGDETGDDDDGLYDFVAGKYPEIAACAGNIERMIVMKYKGKLSRNDQAALILYMQRLLRR